MSDQNTPFAAPASAATVRGSLLSGALITLAVIVALGLIVWVGVCPCERTPGSYLVGPEVQAPVDDWSFVNSDVGLCQIEVRRGLLPHSINLNCMASEGELFLSCARCEGKAWSTAALANPNARVRMNGVVYPVTVQRVVDTITLDRAWRAREGKLGRATDVPRQEGWWSFQVRSRT
jgi:hypothetical protein